MNPNTKRWLKELGSGAWPQGRHALRTDAGYCCLGVACELYRRETHMGWWEEVSAQDGWDESGNLLTGFPTDEEGEPVNHYRFVLPTDASGNVLPERVRAWLGLRNPAGAPIGTDTGLRPEVLAALNDTGSSFPDIAARVWEYPDDYLVEEESNVDL